MTSSTREPFPPPPPTPARPVEEDWHGTTIVDDYQWLEEQESPDTRAWIESQNRYTDALLDSRPRRQELLETFGRLIRVDSRGVPIARGGRVFYPRRLAAEDQPRICLRDGAHGDERVLVDPSELASDESATVELLHVAHDGSRIAYAVREGGRDEIVVRFREVETGSDLPDELSLANYYGVQLLHDGRRFVFTRLDEDGPRTYLRTLGEEGERLLFGEGYGSDKILYAVAGNQDRFLTIHVLEGSAGRKTELWVLDLEADAEPVPVTTDLEATFHGQVLDGRLYITTNYEAPNGRVLAVDAADPDRAGWAEVVPERDDAVIEDVTYAGGRLLVHRLENVQSRVGVFGASGEDLGEIELEDIGTVASIRGTWTSDDVYLGFGSFHVPNTVFHVDLATGAREVWFRPDVPFDTGDIEVEQVRFPSKDGTEVPMFLVHRKGLERDGRRPTVLTGYGGFRTSLSPMFSMLALVWADLGGVYAVANLRGGGEFGEAWHHAGMRERKQNTFDDFFAASEALIERGYTSPDKLAIFGGSNGGLLVGAAMTQRPDLYQAVVCTYPLLDMVRYDRFLVAKYWVPEYGSATEPEHFGWLHAYSPYHRVAEGTDYPATLFVTGDGDTRVDPLHARKMTALLQTKSTLERPVMIRYHTDQGHSGGTPARQQIEDAAELVTFLAWQLDA